MKMTQEQALQYCQQREKNLCEGDYTRKTKDLWLELIQMIEQKGLDETLAYCIKCLNNISDHVTGMHVAVYYEFQQVVESGDSAWLEKLMKEETSA